MLAIRLLVIYECYLFSSCVLSTCNTDMIKCNAGNLLYKQHTWTLACVIRRYFKCFQKKTSSATNQIQQRLIETTFLGSFFLQPFQYLCQRLLYVRLSRIRPQLDMSTGDPRGRWFTLKPPSQCWHPKKYITSRSHKIHSQHAQLSASKFVGYTVSNVVRHSSGTSDRFFCVEKKNVRS